MSLVVENISKRFSTLQRDPLVLSDVSFGVKRGEFVALVGPSGCGKSTLLRIMIGLEKSSSGRVTFEGKKLIAGAGQATMIFQHFALFPWFSVFENIEFGLRMKNVATSKRKTMVNDLIEEVGLGGFADKHPKELSGGMRQRVGIARALSLKPELLFCDEPFSALDAFTAESLRQDLLEIWHRRKMTVVMVTHLVEEAIEMADRIIVFTPQPGTVEKNIENTLSRPRDKRSSAFFAMVDQLTELIKV